MGDDESNRTTHDPRIYQPDQVVCKQRYCYVQAAFQTAACVQAWYVPWWQGKTVPTNAMDDRVVYRPKLVYA